MKSTSPNDFKELEIWKNMLHELQDITNSKINFLIHRINYIESGMKYKKVKKMSDIICPKCKSKMIYMGNDSITGNHYRCSNRKCDVVADDFRFYGNGIDYKGDKEYE